MEQTSNTFVIPQYVIKDLTWLSKGTSLQNKQQVLMMLVATDCLDSWHWLRSTKIDYTKILDAINNFHVWYRSSQE